MASGCPNWRGFLTADSWVKPSWARERTLASLVVEIEIRAARPGEEESLLAV